MDSRTWSGTPAHLCAELQRRGALAATIDSEAYFPRPFVLGVKTLSKLYYAGSRYLRLGRLERPLRARHVEAELRRAGNICDVLHLNAHALPAFPDPEDFRRRHYLFTDTTWDLWQRHATDAARVSPRLARDAERLERQAYHQMTGVFSISEYVKENLVSHYGVPAERISVVGTGRGAILPFHGEKDYAEGNILFVAKERFQDKGGGALLAGFRLARRARPELKLFLVGREEYRALAVGEENVFASGRVPLAELQRLFERASLFIMPAVNEPWGLVYLEALSCRTPIIGLRRLAFPEITQNGRFGFCLETGTPEEIADALIEASRDSGRLATMGAEGQRYCLERFTWEKTVQRILDGIAKHG